MTEDGEPVPDVPLVEPATVAWNLFRGTISYQHAREDGPEDWDATQETFLAGYRAGVADANRTP